MIIFFDLDDTLIDHSHAMRAAAIELHSDLRLMGRDEDFVAEWIAAHRRHYPRYLTGELSYQAVCRFRVRETISAKLGDDEVDELFARYMRSYRASWTLFEDVLPCLDCLKAYTLGIITNGPSTEQRAKLHDLALEDRFRHILISEECGFAKPSHQIFQRACEMAGATAKDVVHVGDHFEIDFCGSRNAGIRGIWLNRVGSVNGLGHHDVIMSLLQLPKILQLSDL